MNTPLYASVIVDLALDKALDYSIPLDMREKATPGMQVEIPFRGKFRSGFIIEIKSHTDCATVKPIAQILSNERLISEELLKLALWMARYYCSPLSEIFKILIPTSIREMMKPKEQLFVMRNKSREELQQHCIDHRQRCPAQAAILDVMLLVKKGILLTELLEKAGSSRSSVDSLVSKGLLAIDIVRIDRSPLMNEEYFPSKAKSLNSDQDQALKKIVSSLKASHFETHLIFGITGSGKTEIYLQAIEQALQMGKGTIMLVPEISLTTQTIERFRSRFKEKIAILHHRLSQGERNDEWHHIHEGRAKIVIGARSAIFSPVVNLGLIIVDEEHELTYKQTESSPCYQGRDVAVMRGKIANSTVILGSATPSLESFYNAKNNKYTLSTLHHRASAASLPKTTIIDMKKEYEKNKGFTNFSEKLLNGIEKRIKDGEQTILFLNRRGYHTTMQCSACHQALKCAHCDVSLTFHFNDNQLACHLCGYSLSPPPKDCPHCRQGKPLKFKGVGTELIEKSLHALLPTVRTLRIDADTTKHKGSQQKLLKEFGSGKADVLIGTQMIAKGLHFPQVTLVGILNADASLNIPDFRASETSFQLITQVAGRSGRGQMAGEVIIQSSIPDHSTILHASNQDFETFYREEIEVRKEFDYPPFTRLAKISFSGKNERQVVEVAQQTRSQLTQYLPSNYKMLAILPCGHAKVKDHYRYQFIIQAPQLNSLHQAIQQLRHHYRCPSAVKMNLDVDPSSTFF